jgi:hypothetical protein
MGTASTTNDRLALWLSRTIRWALGLVLLWLAYTYDEAQILYLVGAVVFATGFLRPRRCTSDHCNIDNHPH